MTSVGVVENLARVLTRRQCDASTDRGNAHDAQCRRKEHAGGLTGVEFVYRGTTFTQQANLVPALYRASRRPREYCFFHMSAFDDIVRIPSCNTH